MDTSYLIVSFILFIPADIVDIRVALFQKEVAFIYSKPLKDSQTENTYTHVFSVSSFSKVYCNLTMISHVTSSARQPADFQHASQLLQSLLQAA